MKSDELKLIMKEFETMINTADVALADKLIASNAPFYRPYHLNRYMVVKVICRLCIL